MDKEIGMASRDETKHYERATITSANSITDFIPPTKTRKLHLETYKSPKKRLELSGCGQNGHGGYNKNFKFGNYNRYYGYRYMEHDGDVRLKVFLTNEEMFTGKEILDIGCNIGSLTFAIAKNFRVKHICGIDIDKALINQAKKLVQRARKCRGEEDISGFPLNVFFEHGNYVVRDPVLLEVEESHRFDLILCLSVTKWIHLNFGDEGLKLAFKRMYRQLRPTGKLILEAQPWSSYKRRKRLTLAIEKNYKGIKLHPEDFTEYLLSDEVGFSEMYELAKTSASKGFQRPLQVFVKR